MALLELNKLTIQFGGLIAVNKVDLKVEKGQISALIGPNGAGKSTAFNLATGIYSPTSGKVLYKGQDISGKPPYYINGLGIARTFQNIRLFKELTVLDNVKIGCHSRSKAGIFGAITRLSAIKNEEKQIGRAHV